MSPARKATAGGILPPGGGGEDPPLSPAAAKRAAKLLADAAERMAALSDEMRAELFRIERDGWASTTDGNTLRTWHALQSRRLVSVFRSESVPAWAIARLSPIGAGLLLQWRARPRPAGPNVVDLGGGSST